MVSFDGCLSACVNMNIRNTVSLTQIRHRYSTDVSSIYTSFTCGSIYTPIFSHAKTEVRDQCHNLSLFQLPNRFWASTPSTWLKIFPHVSTRFCSSSGLFSNCSARNIKQPKQQMPIIDIEVLNFPHERCFGLICTPFFQWFWGCCLGNDGCWTCMNMFDLLSSSNLLKTILKMETVQQDFGRGNKKWLKKKRPPFQRFRQLSLMRLKPSPILYGIKWRNLCMVFSGPTSGCQAFWDQIFIHESLNVPENHHKTSKLQNQ